jgi:hypothetical protein
MRVNIKLMMNFGIILKVIFGLQINGFVDFKVVFFYFKEMLFL